METTAINKVLEDFEHLPLEDREFVLEVMRKQQIELKRDAIAKRSEEAIANLKKRFVRRGGFQDLRKDLEGA